MVQHKENQDEKQKYKKAKKAAAGAKKQEEEAEMLQNDEDVFGDNFDIDVHDVLGSLGFDDFDLDYIKMKYLELIN